MKLGNFQVVIYGGEEVEDGYVEIQHRKNYSIVLTNLSCDSCDAEVKVDGKNVGIIRLSPNQVVYLERPVNDTGKFTFYKDGTPEAIAANLDKVLSTDKGLISVTFKPGIEKISKLRPVPIPNPRQTPWYPPLIPPYPYPNPPQPHGPYWSDTGLPSNDYVVDSNPQIRSSDISYEAGQHTNKVSRGLSGQSLSSYSNYTSGGTGLSGKSNQTFYDVTNLEYLTDQFVTINLRLVCKQETDEKSPRPLKPVKNIRSNDIPKPV